MRSPAAPGRPARSPRCRGGRRSRIPRLRRRRHRPRQPPRRRLHPPVLNGSLKDIGRQAAREAERELIFRTLQHTRWNRREAAEMLGISYKALLYKIKEAELDKAS